MIMFVSYFMQNHLIKRGFSHTFTKSTIADPPFHSYGLLKLNSERLEEEEDVEMLFRQAHGIVVPGGFGGRGVEGKIKAIRFARENNIPFLGLCLGMQCAVIEFARNMLKLKGANSSEFDAETKHPVIDLLPEQKDIADKGGTMRLGAYPCKIVKGTMLDTIYKTDQVAERHRHRYEFNNDYRADFTKAGMVCSGINPEKDLVEVVEIPAHPFFLATQYHPEFKSRPTKPHPIFSAFIKAAAACLDEQVTMFEAKK